ncbi:MAG TPA: hypothetical protein VGV59_06380 [Pyrinomonadaceae bacterium]|nr:hypothetical protein [Pyrinomonadaceae bacterium]
MKRLQVLFALPIALDKGLLKAEAAAMREVAPGRLLLVPGPRFEPTRSVTRTEFAASMTRLLAEMFGE